MISSTITGQFLYWEKNKEITYPGCLENDSYLLLVLRMGNLEHLFSFSPIEGSPIDLHKIDLSRVHPLDKEYVVRSSIPPYDMFSRECLDYVYKRGRISKEYYEQQLKVLETKLAKVNSYRD